MRIDQDDFDEWRAHPVTQALLQALGKQSDVIRQQWCQVSLDGGRNDPLELAEFRTRLRVYQELREMTAERLEEIYNEQS